MEPSNATGTGPHTTFIAKPAFYWLRSLVHLFQDAFQCMIGWELSCTFTVISWSGRQPLNHGALAYFFKCIFPFLEENLAAECNVNIKNICQFKEIFSFIIHVISGRYWVQSFLTGVICRLVCQKQVPRAWTSNYIPQYLWWWNYLLYIPAFGTHFHILMQYPFHWTCFYISHIIAKFH